MEDKFNLSKKYKKYIYSVTACKSGPCRYVWVLEFNNNLGLIIRLMKSPGEQSGFYYGLNAIYFDANDDHYFDVCKEIDSIIPHYLMKESDIDAVVIDIKSRRKYTRKWKLLIR